MVSETRRINVRERIPTHIPIGIQPATKPDRIPLDVPSLFGSIVRSDRSIANAS